VIERPRRLRVRPRATSSRRRGPRAAIGRADQKLLIALRTRGHDERTDRIVGALGTFGEWGLGWAAIGLAGAAADRAGPRGWLSAALASPTSVMANYAVKLVVGRERPLIEDHPMLARAPSKLSFPSAHSTSAVTGAVALGRVAPALKPGLYVLAASICIGRPYLGMHYPSDVLAGVALGSVLGRAWPLPPESLPREHWAR
jgi:membrane-associated phospholipid phosphatase